MPRDKLLGAKLTVIDEIRKVLESSNAIDVERTIRELQKIMVFLNENTTHSLVKEDNHDEEEGTGHDDEEHTHDDDAHMRNENEENSHSRLEASQKLGVNHQRVRNASEIQQSAK